MVCNVGGRERTACHNRQLLADAGFELTAEYELPLDFALLRARRSSSTPHHINGDRDA
jgi:hypothetical protein